jgi:hypothetical protein
VASYKILPPGKMAAVAQQQALKLVALGRSVVANTVAGIPRAIGKANGAAGACGAWVAGEASLGSLAGVLFI